MTVVSNSTRDTVYQLSASRIAGTKLSMVVTRLSVVLQDHGDITTEQSYLDPSLLARLDAAITSLGDATHLHVKVLEQTLQQLPAGPATLNSQRPSTRMRSDSSHGMPGSRLFVNNQEAGQELSECWLQCLMAQADVDLSVAQLGNTL